MEPVEFAAEAEKGIKLRFKTHKLKARPWNIVETVRLMTEAASPDYGIIVDPNFTFETLEESIRLAHELEKYNIEAFEIPIPQSNIDGYLEIQRGCEMLITTHFGNPDPVKAIKAGMNDSFIIAYLDSRAANVKREATIAESAHSSLWIQIVGSA